ncbi:MAG: HDOD domain-containing protein [Planctomycetes bacterium]|nr:HDOD domain-containing protein [Planctomycetota bacterium]
MSITTKRVPLVGREANHKFNAEALERVARDVEIPPVPSVVLELNEMLQGSASIGEIAKLLERDAFVSGLCLKLINSVRYGLRAHCDSILHAASMLGVRKLGIVASEACLLKSYADLSGPPDVNVFDVQKHGVVTAIVARQLAMHVRLPANVDDSMVATCALFHDVGRVALYATFHDRYVELTYTSPLAGASLVSAEIDNYGFHHGDVSALIVERWGLGPRVSQTLSEHHKEMNTGDFTLADVINVADDIVHRYKSYGISGIMNTLLNLPPEFLSIAREDLPPFAQSLASAIFKECTQ